MFAALEADPSRDEGYRRLAVEIAHNIIRATKSVIDTPGAIDNMKQASKFGFMMDPDEDSFARVGLPPTPFTVAFDQQRPGQAAAFNAGNMTLIISVLPPDVAAIASSRRTRKMLSKYVVDELNRQMQIVVHEAVHMLDYMRGNKRMATSAPSARPSMDRSEFTERYYNSPEEFNALYQESIVEILREFKRMNPRSAAQALSTFESFLVVAGKASNTLRELRRHVNPKYRKKLESRLWQMWSHAAQKLEEGQR